MNRIRKTITELARELRKNPTDSEKKLWEELRKRRLNGYRFVRQKPFVYEQNQNRPFFFIADFYCAKRKLVIELDGSVHEYTQYYDYHRYFVLEEMGLKTLRIANSELCDIENVKERILRNLESL